ncbi:MAG TPA: multicopper oxidase domain-containing protein, partial [Burkholderiaceae bacterium]|nr:multicopper oxidase domain-containing protein [Burkholderiaceae bacterium]
MGFNSRGGSRLHLARWAAAVVLGVPMAGAYAEKREFNMTIEEVSINVAPGFNANVFAFNGQVPGPLIHVREGDEVTVHVTNNTTLPH